MLATTGAKPIDRVLDFRPAASLPRARYQREGHCVDQGGRPIESGLNGSKSLREERSVRSRVQQGARFSNLGIKDEVIACVRVRRSSAALGGAGLRIDVG